MINWEELLEKTIYIREFEKIIQDLYSSDCIQSPVHLSIGQELTSVLMAKFYRKGDHLVGNYRSHALSLSITDNLKPIVLELLAKKDGVSGGKAGSMHLSVPEKNLMWTSAIVGTGVPIATGIAESLKRLTKDNLVSVMFGDGAIEEGCVLESLNLSSVFKLPIIFVLEDNGLAIHTKKNVRSTVGDYCEIAKTFNIKTYKASFKNPEHLHNEFEKAYNFTRRERLPSFITIECYRWIEHVGTNFDWSLGYRDKEELEDWKKYDIIESPNIISISSEFVRNKSLLYKEKFATIFKDCMQYPEPENKDLLKNVY